MLGAQGKTLRPGLDSDWEWSYRYWGGHRGHRDVGWQRSEPHAVGEADGDGCRGGLHQDQDRRGDQAALGEEAALVSVLTVPTFLLTRLLCSSVSSSLSIYKDVWMKLTINQVIPSPAKKGVFISKICWYNLTCAKCFTSQIYTNSNWRFLRALEISTIILYNMTNINWIVLNYPSKNSLLWPES